MAAIRQDARTQSANAGKTGLFGPYSLLQISQGEFYDSSLAARRRRGIRQEKEAALAPFESKKAELEQQLMNIERRLLWVERFE